jgi:hypothetical protein
MQTVFNLGDAIKVLATTVDVERVFSMGRLLLPYVRSRLNVQSTHALMCLGSWSLLGLMRVISKLLLVW